MNLRYSKHVRLNKGHKLKNLWLKMNNPTKNNNAGTKLVMKSLRTTHIHTLQSSMSLKNHSKWLICRVATWIQSMKERTFSIHTSIANKIKFMTAKWIMTKAKPPKWKSEASWISAVPPSWKLHKCKLTKFHPIKIKNSALGRLAIFPKWLIKTFLLELITGPRNF
jgi:hypothetical protein